MLGDGSEVLSYLIEAVDTASPVLRAIQDQFVATSRVAQTSLGEIAKAADAATASLGKMDAATKTASGSETQAAAAGTKLADSQKAVADSTKVAAASTAKLDEAQVGALASAGALSRSHESLAKGHTAATTATKAHSNVLTDLSGKLATGSSATKQWGSALSALTVPLAAVGGASLYASAKFGALMEQLRTQAGYSQQSVNQLSAAVVKLSPSLAQTPDQLALALYHIASVGIPAAKALDVLRASAQGANIAGANLDDVSNALSTTMKNFPTIAGGATGAMADLVAIVGHGNLHLEDLVTNLGKVVPVAKSIGLTLPDVGAAIDVLTSHGIAASQATTALRFSFTSLERPSVTALGALGQIGLSQTKLAQDMTKPDGLLVALRDLKSHLDAAYPPGQVLSVQQQQAAIDKYATSLKNAGTAASTYKSDMAKYYQEITSGAGSKVLQSQAILNIFGGARGAQGALPLLQNIPELAGLYKSIPVGKTAIDQLNTSVQAWDKTQQGQLEHLKAGISAAGVAIGQDIGPVVLPMLKDVVKGVEAITQAFSDMPGPVKHAIGILLGIGVVIGPLLLVTSKIMRIGSLLSGLGGRVLGGGAGTGGGVAGALGGEMNAGMIFGVRGPAAPGSITNPIAVAMEGQPAWRGALPGSGNGEGALASETATVEEGASVGLLATLKGGLASMLGNILPAAMIGLGGSFAANLLGSTIGGSAGKTVGGIGTDAAYGAGIGTLFGGPGIGTAIGGGIGALVGGAQALFGTGGNSMDDAIKKMTQELKDLSAAPDPTALKQLHDAAVKFEGSGLASGGQLTALKQIATATTPVAAAYEQLTSGARLSQQNVTLAFTTLASAITQKMASGQESVQTGTQQIDALLALPTAKSNLSAAFEAMVGSITSEMASGKLTVAQGVQDINAELAKIKQHIQISIGVSGATGTGSGGAPNPLSTLGGSNLGANPLTGGSTPALASVTRWASLAQAAAKLYGIPASVLLGQIQQESGGNPALVSKTGAFGVSQFEPGTARAFGVQRGTSTTAVTSQIEGEAEFLRASIKQYGSLTAALEDYYGGPKGVANPNEIVPGGPTPAQYAADVLGKARSYARYGTTAPKGSGVGPLPLLGGGTGKTPAGAGGNIAGKYPFSAAYRALVTGGYFEGADQGIDFTQGPGGTSSVQGVKALAPGIVTTSSPHGGWTIGGKASGGLVVYQITSGPMKGRYVYTTESLTPGVKVGQHLTAGEQIGTYTTGFPGIESGFSQGPGLSPYGNSGEGKNNVPADPQAIAYQNYVLALGSGGKVTIPPYTNPKNAAKSQHFNWQTGKFELMTAATFKALEQSWQAAHPGKAYPSSLTALETDLYGPLRTKPPPGGSVSEFLSLSDTGTAMAKGEAALRSSLTQQGAAIVAASSAAIGADAATVDSSGLTQLQTLIHEARVTGNQQLITGFLKDANSVVKSWDASLKSNFQTQLSTATLTEQLAINNAQLGLSPTAKATVNKRGQITFSKATAAPNPAVTAATDPAYLQAQLTAYGTYINNLTTEGSQLDALLAQEEKHPKKNKTLIDNTKAQIDQVQQALLQANVDVSGIQSAFQTAVYQAFVTNFQTIEQGLEGQSSNAATLQTALDSLGTGAGTSFTALQALSSQQGGLTGPQIAQANADLRSFIQGQYGQESPLAGPQAGAGLAGILGPIISQMQSGGASQGMYAGWASLFGGNSSALGADFTALASGQLSAADTGSTITSVDNLLSTLAGLIAAIATQTTATNTLTGATLQNTAVVSTFGGQVSFTVPGDTSGMTYIAGGTSSSTDAAHIGMGM